MTIKKPCNFSPNRFLKKYCLSDHGQTMVRSAHCGRHKIGFAVQWMVIAWFSSGYLVLPMVLGWSPHGQAVPFLIASSWSLDGLPGKLAPTMVLAWSPYGQASLSLIVPS